MGGGVLVLAVGGQAAYRSYRAARRRARALAAYAAEEADQLEAVAQRLNAHGFALQRTAAELAPKLQRILVFLDTPLVPASLPWLLRRLFSRPFRKRG